MQIDSITITLIIAFANLVLVVVGPVANAVQAAADRRESRRREREEREERQRRDKEQRDLDLHRETESRNALIAEQKRIQNELMRKELHDSLMQAAQTLIRQRARLQYLQGITQEDWSKDIREREEAYGEAFATMLFVNDPYINAIANNVMNPQSSPDDKLSAINQAILKLADLYHQTMERTV